MVSYNNYLAQKYVKMKVRVLGTKQRLLMENSLASFIADNPEDWIEYIPSIIGGTASKTKDDSHLQIIKKYSLLLTLMT